jgi:hypothetical protein
LFFFLTLLEECTINQREKASTDILSFLQTTREKNGHSSGGAATGEKLALLLKLKQKPTLKPLLRDIQKETTPAS